jgi:hypothetical protein
MNQSNHFVDLGYGWLCKHCCAEDCEDKLRHSAATGGMPNGLPLARWTDSSRHTLSCPRCGIEETDQQLSTLIVAVVQTEPVTARTRQVLCPGGQGICPGCPGFGRGCPDTGRVAPRPWAGLSRHWASGAQALGGAVQTLGEWRPAFGRSCPDSGQVVPSPWAELPRPLSGWTKA